MFEWRNRIIFLWLALFWGYSVSYGLPVSAQPSVGAPVISNSAGQPLFVFVAWPLDGSLLGGASGAAPQTLESAWFDAHLPRFYGRRLSLRISENDSLLDYRAWIERNEPECIEGDAEYVNAEINTAALRYIPILEVRLEDESRPYLHEAELIKRAAPGALQGPFGVVSPHLYAGGGAQMQYWLRNGETMPEVIAFESPRETLRHLLVGGIHAAGLPAGWFDRYLRENNRLDLLDRFERVTIPISPPRIAIFLRDDIYQDVFLRTLVAETWLRDQYPNELKLISPSEFDR